jgi:hypothetical protein
MWGVTPDKWQTEVSDTYSKKPSRKSKSGGRRISIRSGHGVGKTTELAWIIIHHATTRFPQKTVCTAATGDQLFDALAAEVKAWILKLPPDIANLFEVKNESIDLKSAPNESFISFRVSRPDKPEALAGVHSENVLLVCDEASGIPDVIFESASGSMSGHNATTILAGNPVRSTGLFADTHETLTDMWDTWTVSCLDCPRVSSDFVEEMKRRYGEQANQYRVRVLGLPPLADEDTVVPKELMETALLRDVIASNVRPIWGLDVARKGNDASALAKRKGNVLTEPVKDWYGKDTMGTVATVKMEWDSTALGERPEDICVDAIGLGAGVADRLRELGLPVRSVNVSEVPAMRDRYHNLRAELWFKMREWFALRNCSLAGDLKTGKQLIGVRYGTQKQSGKLIIEQKDDTRSREKSSPDRADAVMLTFASEAITMLGGPHASKSWSQPLRREIRSIV